MNGVDREFLPIVCAVDIKKCDQSFEFPQEFKGAVTSILNAADKVDLKEVYGFVCGTDAAYDLWKKISDLWVKGSLPDGKGMTLDPRRGGRSTITKTDIKPVHTMPDWAILECGKKVLSGQLCVKTVTEEVWIALAHFFGVSPAATALRGAGSLFLSGPSHVGIVTEASSGGECR
jgi:hypothetical protein